MTERRDGRKCAPTTPSGGARSSSAKQIDMITIVEDGDKGDNDSIFNEFSSVLDNDDGSSSSQVGVGVRNDAWPSGNSTVVARHKRYHGRG